MSFVFYATLSQDLTVETIATSNLLEKLLKRIMILANKEMQSKPCSKMLLGSRCVKRQRRVVGNYGICLLPFR